MLYLLRSFGVGNKSALKIGFTDDMVCRLGQYKIHNPFFELISTRQGTQDDELYLHLYLMASGYKARILNEWFIDCPDIYTIFHKPISSLHYTIWRRRDLLFDISDFTNPLHRRVYEDLRREFGPARHLLPFEVSWKFAESREKLRRMKTEHPYI